MNLSDILSRYDEQVRQNVATEPGITVEHTQNAVRISGQWNCVLFSQLTEVTADREIAEQKSHFETLGKEVEWKLYGHDKPTDLSQRLQRAGFQAESLETFLVFDLQGGPPKAELPADVRFERVTDEKGLADLATVGLQAFDEDFSSMNDEFLARIPLRTVSLFVAYKNGEPVCAGRLETPANSEFAGIYGGGTVPEFRHQGIYRSLIAIRAEEAVDRGYRFLAVDAADTSLPILKRLGFFSVTTVCAWVWKPAP